uniref:Uncharacterized protein n=1 Tax=Rousettus aegyptiacus TaxID=9407 RepID=A0A7J8E8R4_ROUAE|nr:hypothetical protein HJG63_008258 [Rousettus aegyptiacus]
MRRCTVPADGDLSLSLWGQLSGQLSGGPREGAGGDRGTGRLDRGRSTGLHSSSLRRRAGVCRALAGGLGSGPCGAPANNTEAAVSSGSLFGSHTPALRHVLRLRNEPPSLGYSQGKGQVGISFEGTSVKELACGF